MAIITQDYGSIGGGEMTIETKQATVGTPVTFDNFENGTVAYYSMANEAPVAILVIKDGVVDTVNSHYGTGGYYMFSYDTTTHTVSFTLSYNYNRKDVVAISYS